MKKAITLICTILLTISVSSQVVDAKSGATSMVEEKVINYQDPRSHREYNNDNFDNYPLVPLKISLPYIGGEISNPGVATLEDCEIRLVFIKEVIPESKGGEPVFRGFFKYSGYPLADLLNDFIIKKSNMEEFSPVVDLFVVVENDLGESAVFSWGEIFFSKRGRDIIFATAVSPIFPTKADDRWEIPTECSIIAGNDFLTVRNIKQPTKITIRSFPARFQGKKGATLPIEPMISLSMNGDVFNIDAIPDGSDRLRFPTAFFGLHMGYKNVSTFEGYSLGDILNRSVTITTNDIQHGLLAAGASDGYRVVYSLSEILNRTDLEAVLLIDRGKADGGRFVIFPSADLFADRQLKSVMKGYIVNFK
jgi:hypothetical protein